MGATCRSDDLEAETWTGEPEHEGDLVPFRNGLVDVGTGALHPHTPGFFATRRIEAKWIEGLHDEAILKTVMAGSTIAKFLADTFSEDPQQIVALQEVFGTIFFGDNRLQKAFVLIGDARSGKGTINRLIADLMGSAACGPSTKSLTGNFSLQSLVNKRYAGLSDVRQDTQNADFAALAELVLAITGGDPRDVDRKHMTTLTGIILAVRFMFISNGLPDFRDVHGVLASRMIYFKTTGSHLGDEDTTLTVRLLAERDLIAAWAVHGWRRVLARGARAYITETPTHKRLSGTSMARMAPIAAFAAENLEYTGSVADWIETEDVFVIFDAWRAKRGVGTITRKKFAIDMDRCFEGIDQAKITVAERRLIQGQGDEPSRLVTPDQQPPGQPRRRAYRGLAWKEGKHPSPEAMAAAYEKAGDTARFMDSMTAEGMGYDLGR